MENSPLPSLVEPLGFLVYLPPSGPKDRIVPTPLVPLVLGTVVIPDGCPLNDRDSNAQWVLNFK